MPASLQGRTVLITRTRSQASALAAGVAALGAAPIVVPTLEIVAPESFSSLDRVLTFLDSFHLVVMTSPNAVVAASARAKLLSVTFSPPRLAAIGPATAAALAAAGIVPEREPLLVPPVAVAESLATYLLTTLHELGPAWVKERDMQRREGQGGPVRVAMIRAETARDVVPETLRAAGAEVVIAAAYRTVVPVASVALLQQHFTPPLPFADAVTFTSSSTAEHLLHLLAAAGIPLPPTARRVSIGPVTSATLRALGVPPHTEAASATIPSLLEALAAALASPPSSV